MLENFCGQNPTNLRRGIARGGMRALEALRNTTGQRLKMGEKFFIFFGGNPLKSPESAKGIQGNARRFPWTYLDFLGFIWRQIAPRL
jgi:hypothetical protein